MTPEQERKLDRAISMMEAMQVGQDIVNAQSIRKVVVPDAFFGKDNEEAGTANINQSIGAETAFTSPKEFDLVQTVEINGVLYKIGLYNN